MAETSDFKAEPPVGIDPIGASSEGASLYELIREDIIEGRLAANERLVVTDLARRHGTSTNPVREALQLLRGEGFVTFVANRGARVRPIDQDFVRDIYEIGVLIEPALTRWFVNMATGEDIAELERIQALIEENNFADTLQAQRTGYRLPHRDVPAPLQPPCRRALVEASRSAASREPAFQFHARAACRRSCASTASSSRM